MGVSLLNAVMHLCVTGIVQMAFRPVPLAVKSADAPGIHAR
tara:strand:- start:3813 stop:3935 length:123 start_codon:yes stop_codon:yes gene_type:complete